MFCTKCGKELKNDTAFCIYCGNPTGISTTVRNTASEKAQKPTLVNRNRFDLKLFFGSLLLCLALTAGGLGVYFFVINNNIASDKDNTTTAENIESLDSEISINDSKTGEDIPENQAAQAADEYLADTLCVTGYEVETIDNNYCYFNSDGDYCQLINVFQKPVIQGNNPDVIAAINASLDEMAEPYKAQLEKRNLDEWRAGGSNNWSGEYEFDRTPGIDINLLNEYMKDNFSVNVSLQSPYILQSVYYDNHYLSILWSIPYDSWLHGYSCAGVTFDLSTGERVSIYDLVETDPREMIREGLQAAGYFDAMYDWESYDVLHDTCFYIDEDTLYVVLDGHLFTARTNLAWGISFSREDWHFIDSVWISDGINEYIDSVLSSSPDGSGQTAFIETAPYILPTSNSDYLTLDDLKGLTKEQCRIARNELYARHGRLFNDEELQAYFNSCDWYYGYLAPDNFDDSILNEYEKANRDLIVQYEQIMGYR